MDPMLASNPFFSSFSHSDLFGKLIFLSLFACSVISWTLLVYKIKQTRNTQKSTKHLTQQFTATRHLPLNFSPTNQPSHPLTHLYVSLRQRALEILNKNYQANDTHTLSTSDIEQLGSHLNATIAQETKGLERNLYILPTITSLAPFLGLLGTVWGILISLGELGTQAGGGASQTMLGGIAMALGTTVLGLLVAIPPLIGYSYLKSALRNTRIDMQDFAANALGAVELQYRKADV